MFSKNANNCRYQLVSATHMKTANEHLASHLSSIDRIGLGHFQRITVLVLLGLGAAAIERARDS